MSLPTDYHDDGPRTPLNQSKYHIVLQKASSKAVPDLQLDVDSTHSNKSSNSHAQTTPTNRTNNDNTNDTAQTNTNIIQTKQLDVVISTHSRSIIDTIQPKGATTLTSSQQTPTRLSAPITPIVIPTSSTSPSPSPSPPPTSTPPTGTPPSTVHSTYQVYPRRWWMLLIFSYFSLSSAMTWLAYAPISNIFMLYYGVNDFAINALSMMYMIIYVIGAFPVNSWMAQRSLSDGLKCGAYLNVVGAIIRILPFPFTDNTHEHYPIGYVFAMLGTIFCSIAQLFVLAAPVSVAQNWFPAEERVTATALGAVANSMGSAVAFALVPITLGEQASEQAGEQAEVAKQVPVERLLLAQLGIVATSALFIILFFQSEPLTPPSHSAAQQRQARLKKQNQTVQHTPLHDHEHLDLHHHRDEHEQHDHDHEHEHEEETLSVKETIKECLKSKPFRIVLVVFGIAIGVSYSVGTLLSALLSNSGYGTNVSSLGGIILVLSGIVSGFLFGYIADKTRWYKHLVTFSLVLMVAVMVLFALIPQLPHSVGLIYMICILMGIFMNSPLPILMDMSAEVVYPLSGDISCQFLMVSSNSVGLVLLLIISPIQSWNASAAGWILLIVTGVACVTWPFYQGQSKRLEFEQHANHSDGDHPHQSINQHRHSPELPLKGAFNT